jgi:hypothetical protein
VTRILVGSSHRDPVSGYGEGNSAKSDQCLSGYVSGPPASQKNSLIHGWPSIVGLYANSFA